MMPKGVEHRLARFNSKGKPMVKIPMMPKGVEHFVEAVREMQPFM